jgi:hypothetical protein
MAYQTDPHASHDPLLIASLADGETAGPDHVRAEALVASCTDCAALHADLLALASATRSLPPPARPRDFQLTPADAARLRPAGWRRLLDGLGTSRDGLSRPLAIGLSTLGLAGLLVATVPSFFAGAAGGAASLDATGQSGAARDASSPDAFSAETDDGSIFNGADPAASGDAQGGGWSEAAPAPTELEAADTGEAQIMADSTSGLSPFVAISGVTLGLGLGLFALRWSARRLGDG